MNKREAKRLAHAAVAVQILSWCDWGDKLDFLDQAPTEEETEMISDAIVEIGHQHERKGKAQP